MGKTSTTLGGLAPLQPPAIEFYPRLESLRGLAALMVAGSHCYQSPWLDVSGNEHHGLAGWPTALGQSWTTAGRVLAGLWDGEGAVVVFFVISGFVLSGSLMRGRRGFPTASIRFVLARVFRIYPVAFATIALFATIFWTAGASLADAGAYGSLALLRNALLISADINGVMWSLQIEVIAVPLLIAAFWGWRKWGATVPTSMLIVLTILLFYKPWRSALPFALNIVAFLPGVLVFLAGRAWYARLSQRAAQGLLCLAIVGFVAGIPIVGFFNPWTVVTAMTSGAMMVGLLAYANLGRLGRLFDLFLIRFYGRISYSFYVLHPLALLVIWKMPARLGAIVQAGVPPSALGFILFVLSAVAIAPIAWCSYILIERPGVMAGRRIVQSLRLTARPDRITAPDVSGVVPDASHS